MGPLELFAAPLLLDASGTAIAAGGAAAAGGGGTALGLGTAATLAGAGASAYGALNQPSIPKPLGPTRMPDPESPEAIAARRKKIGERRAAAGRDSTILTEDDEYSNTVLGE
jgi:hypothetical protein